jgi:myo-inositol-1(or 4)-monophosphatase
MTQSQTGGPAGSDGSHADWLAACRRATTGLRAMLGEHPTTRERAEETGTRGEGGDRTLVIDRAAEDLVFAELDKLHADGRRFVAISEERGEVDYGDAAVRVVIDPIDGSLNAKRGLTHHCLSVAVAEGDTMADVVFGYVHDLGADEEWVASSGAGAYRGGHRLDTRPGERRADDGKLEVLGIESADPRWVAEAADELRDSAHRLRALGSIAISLCQVAAARFDGMVTLKRCRSVDAAAGQLIVREAGGLIAFTGYEDPLAAPLDLVPHSPVIAARTERALKELRALPRA